MESGGSQEEPAKVGEEGGHSMKELEGGKGLRRVSPDTQSISGGLSALLLNRVSSLSSSLNLFVQ